MSRLIDPPSWSPRSPTRPCRTRQPLFRRPRHRCIAGFTIQTPTFLAPRHTYTQQRPDARFFSLHIPNSRAQLQSTPPSPLWSPVPWDPAVPEWYTHAVHAHAHPLRRLIDTAGWSRLDDPRPASQIISGVALVKHNHPLCDSRLPTRRKHTASPCLISRATVSSGGRCA